MGPPTHSYTEYIIDEGIGYIINLANELHK